MTDKAAKAKLFFPNLDGLRFFCFFAVFLWHANGTILSEISNTGVKHFFDFVFRNGNLGVNAFFVLSGFLITFLLIKERELTNNISLGNFYIRRILRIWPLYYLCILLGFIIFPYLKQYVQPGPQSLPHITYYLLLAANFDLIHMKPLGIYDPLALSLTVLWSVAVEEQFYLTWPVILKYVKRISYPFVFVAIIVFTLVFRSFYTGHDLVNYSVRDFHTLSVIGDMALGGLTAYLCSFDNKFYRYIMNMPRWQIVIGYIAGLVMILYKQEIFYSTVMMVLERILLATFFAFVIIEQNFAHHSFYKFSRFRIVSNLGVYTYGLYCLHFIGILFVKMAAEKFGFPISSVLNALLVFAAALLVSIGLSLASYHLYEKYFLKLKDRFAFITKK